jgi:hypothetical protein
VYKHSTSLDEATAELKQQRRDRGLKDSTLPVHDSGAGDDEQSDDGDGLHQDTSLQHEQIDSRAKNDIKLAIKTFEEEKRNATDRERAFEIGKTIEKLEAYLKSGTGPLGRSRTFATKEKRARTNVKKAIDRALKTIEEYHPQLFKHLNGSIKTGHDCIYRPSLDIPWTLY